MARHDKNDLTFAFCALVRKQRPRLKLRAFARANQAGSVLEACLATAGASVVDVR